MKKIISLMLALLLALSVCACSKPKDDNAGALPNEKVDMNVYVLTGPTGIGAVNLMDTAKNGTGLHNYKFTAVAAPTDIVAKISNKEADIAAVPTNLAASLYNRTNGGVKVLAVNTLGVLYVLTNEGTEVNSIADLKNKKVYTTGQGSNPEYIINYILEKNGLNVKTDLDIQFKAEGTELATVWATEPNAVIISPQPVATSITMKYKGSKMALDLTKEWEKVSSDSALMQGCVIVRNEFLAAHPEAVKDFLTDYKASIEKAKNDYDTTATLCETYGIVAKAAVAKAAMPYVGLCFIDGSEMKTKLSGFLTVLHAANPKAVGGKLPADDFWYEK